MYDDRLPVTLAEAERRLWMHLLPKVLEKVPLHEAHGRILGEDIIADRDVPAFDRAAVDGFALRSEDIQGASSQQPVELKVIGTVGAGYVPEKPLSSGEALRIMTGAKIPEGADLVYMVEKTELVEKNGALYVRITRPIEAGKDIALTGSDMARGSVLLPAGRRIMAGEMAVLATFGFAEVSVVRSPRIGIAATGNEVVPVDQPLADGHIHDSNSPMLWSLATSLGLKAHRYEVFPDRLDTLVRRIEQVLADDEVDVLLTTGGVSVGDFDYMLRVYEALGAEVLFNRLAFRPGQPTSVARLGGKMLFGLSGNPGASYVGFHLLVRPYVLRSMGVQAEEARLPHAQATLTEAMTRPSTLPKYIRAELTASGDRLLVRPAGSDRSSLVSTIYRSNALALIPAGEGLAAGSVVDVYYTDGPRH